jgi:hypothetical protein
MRSLPRRADVCAAVAVDAGPKNEAGGSAFEPEWPGAAAAMNPSAAVGIRTAQRRPDTTVLFLKPTFHPSALATALGSIDICTGSKLRRAGRAGIDENPRISVGQRRTRDFTYGGRGRSM